MLIGAVTKFCSIYQNYYTLTFGPKKSGTTLIRGPLKIQTEPSLLNTPMDKYRGNYPNNDNN